MTQFSKSYALVEWKLKFRIFTWSQVSKSHFYSLLSHAHFHLQATLIELHWFKYPITSNVCENFNWIEREKHKLCIYY